MFSHICFKMEHVKFRRPGLNQTVSPGLNQAVYPGLNQAVSPGLNQAVSMERVRWVSDIAVTPRPP